MLSGRRNLNTDLPPNCSVTDMNGMTDLRQLLANLRPVLSNTEYVYHCLPILTSTDKILNLLPLATIQENEGITVILDRAQADSQQLEYLQTFRLITLSVHSSLLAVGLTAAVSRALTDAGIPANFLAGFNHDHILVPNEKASLAVDVLARLAQGR